MSVNNNIVLIVKCGFSFREEMKPDSELITCRKCDMGSAFVTAFFHSSEA